MVRLRWFDLRTAACTVWGEARGEVYEGRLAVACVIYNRVLAQSWYGDSVAAVCLKKWQFSCWNKGDPNRDKLLDIEAGGDARLESCIVATLAARDLAGTVADPSGGATHYHASSVSPSWAAHGNQTVTIGNHLFYRDVD